MARKTDIHALDRDQLIVLVQRLQLRLLARRATDVRRGGRRDAIHDPEKRREVEGNMESLPKDLQKWILNELMPGIVDLPAYKHQLYFSELWAIGRSLAEDLHLDIGDQPYKLAVMFTGLLTHDPDDDDAEDVEPDLPKIGDLVHS